MFDTRNLPSDSRMDVQVFSAGTGVWVKPRSTSWTYVLMLAAGAGGQYGATGIGGAGGGSGAAASGLFLTALLPEELNVTVGVGSNGGFSGQAATVGGNTVLQYGQSSNTVIVLIGGQPGTIGANTAAATLASTVSTFAIRNFPGIGWFNNAAVSALGANGGSTSDGMTAIGGGFVSGGGGGAGGASHNGGGVTSDCAVISNTASGSVNGTPGFSTLALRPELVSLHGIAFGVGGAGGSSNATVGSWGGDGGLGCGGGGAAVVTGSETIGGLQVRAGRGGDGVALFLSW
jgi:hypothetical protein